MKKIEHPYSLSFPSVPILENAGDLKETKKTIDSSKITDSLDDIEQMAINVAPSVSKFGEDMNSFVKNFMSCASKMPMCVLLPINNNDCFLQCLLGAHKVTNHLKDSVKEVLNSFCEKSKAVFETEINLVDEHGHSSNVQKLKSYLTSSGVKVSDYEKLASVWVKSLPLKLIRFHNQDSDMSQLKTIAKDMIRRIGIMDSEDCQSDKLSIIQKRLVGLFYKNPRILDVLFSGYFMGSKAATIVPGPMQPIFDAFTTGMKVATSASCGIIYFAEQVIFFVIFQILSLGIPMLI